LVSAPLVGTSNTVNESVVETLKSHTLPKVISNVKDVSKLGLVHEALGSHPWEGLDYRDEGDRSLIATLQRQSEVDELSMISALETTPEMQQREARQGQTWYETECQEGTPIAEGVEGDVVDGSEWSSQTVMGSSEEESGESTDGDVVMKPGRVGYLDILGMSMQQPQELFTGPVWHEWQRAEVRGSRCGGWGNWWQ
jgi:hypothetical protein